MNEYGDVGEIMFLGDIAILGILVIFTLLTLVGWGLIGTWILRIGTPCRFDANICWLGFSLLIGFLEIIHLFVAINWQVTLFVFSVGLVGVLRAISYMNLNKCSSIFTYRRPISVRTLFLIGLLFFVVWILRSMGPVNNYDSGIYHFGSIRWVNEYPIVPGLGNVFTALAYNQSYFLYLGLLNISPYWNHGYALGGLVLLTLTGVTLLQFCMRSSVVLRWTFGAPIFIFLGYLAGTLSNPSPDTAISLIQIVMFLLLVTLIFDETSPAKRRNLLLSTLIFLAISIVTIKVSSAMFALISLGLTLLYAKRAFFLMGHWKLVLMIGSLVGLTHLARGYLLSGAPLYPSEIGAKLDLPWAMSVDAITGERFWIYIWSRLPGAMPAEVIGTWAWFPHWIDSLSIENWIFAGALLCLSLANIFMLFLDKSSASKRLRLVLALPLISTIIFWFLSAPQIRFLGAIPLLLLVLNLWFFWDLIKNRFNLWKSISPKHYSYFAIFSLACICLISLKLTGLRSLSIDGWAPLPKIGTILKTTSHGVVLNVPAEGNQCWVGTLPCSPQVRSELDLIPWPESLSKFSFLQIRPVYRLKY